MPVRVLNLFSIYLSDTVNWAFRMLQNLPDAEIVIGSKDFRHCNYYPKEFEYAEFPLRVIDMNRKNPWVRLFNKFRNFLANRLYSWYLAKVTGRLDLMHSHFAFNGWTYLGLARRLQVPHVVSFYGYDYEYLPFTKPIWKKRYEVLFAEADLFLCEGRHGAETLVKMGCPRSKVEVCPLGVEVAAVPYLPRTKTSGELNLLQIATLTEKKGHVYTVQAFVKALAECPNMTLTLVGQDRETDKKSVERELRDMLAGTPAEDRVQFVKRVDFSRLYEYMQSFDVFIHPSVHASDMDAEGGAPVVLLDCQATGMPVISTTHCDIPDEVVHGMTGLLAPEREVDGLVEYIKTFYNMPNDQYQQFALAARKHVEECYDVRKNAEFLRDIYRKLLERKRGLSQRVALKASA